MHSKRHEGVANMLRHYDLIVQANHDATRPVDGMGFASYLGIKKKFG